MVGSSDAARISTLIYGDFYTGGREKCLFLSVEGFPFSISY